MEKIASIRLTNLDILLRLITFQIAPVNITFLLCFIVIDEYMTFFNNITNLVIQL